MKRFRPDPASRDALRRLAVGDHVRWDMPFVGLTQHGTVARRSRGLVTIHWDNGLVGRFGFDNMLIWNLEKLA
jgi:hypothetical protein